MFGRRSKTPQLAAESSSTSVRAPARSPSEALKPVAIVHAPRVRRPRGGLLSLLSGLLTAGVVVAGVLVFGVLALEGEVDKPGPLAADKIVFIPKNTGTSEIADLLTRENVVANPRLFELYAYLKRRKGQLKAGEFMFFSGVTISEAIDTLIDGKAISHSLTLPEGLTSEQMLARIRENDILTGDVTDVPREGSLMPDTYKFERGMTRQQLVNLLQSTQRDFLNKLWARRAPDLVIKTPQELVILASIVEKETGRADERPRVASVFYNRLQRRMKLQSDPTIVYGIVGGKGTLGRGITRQEIDARTPYNTYAIEGLPVGPIANPGRAALEAVANPLKTRDVYFVADGTGGHAFAETLDQHNRNVVRWRQIERSREAAGGQPGVDAAPTPDNRTELDAAPGPSRATSAFVDSGRGGAPAGRAFDAVEGTARDPLRVQNWDLSSPKTVPQIGPEPPPAAASRPSARAASRNAKSERREAAVGLPPGFERTPPR